MRGQRLHMKEQMYTPTVEMSENHPVWKEIQATNLQVLEQSREVAHRLHQSHIPGIMVSVDLV